MLTDTEKMLFSIAVVAARPLGMDLQSLAPSPLNPEEHWPEETDLRSADVGDFFLNLDIFINP